MVPCQQYTHYLLLFVVRGSICHHANTILDICCYLWSERVFGTMPTLYSLFAVRRILGQRRCLAPCQHYTHYLLLFVIRGVWHHASSYTILIICSYSWSEGVFGTMSTLYSLVNLIRGQMGYLAPCQHYTHYLLLFVVRGSIWHHPSTILTTCTTILMYLLLFVIRGGVWHHANAILTICSYSWSP